MSIATLAEVLQPALKQGYAVAGLVTLGWEDMRAYVAAAEAEGLPVILQAGPSCRAHTPLPVLGKMFRHLAENASVPVVAHLDHGYTFEECREALDSGFTSLMFDGSRKPLDAEHRGDRARSPKWRTRQAFPARAKSVLSAIRAGENSAGTDPEEAARFARDTASTPWRSRSATCICSRTGKAGSTSRASAPSRR
jgi:fructose-bisphosphate aldolase class II